MPPGGENMTEPTLKEDKSELKNEAIERRELFNLSPLALLTTFLASCSDDSAKFGGKSGRKNLISKNDSSGTGGTGNGPDQDELSKNVDGEVDNINEMPKTPPVCSPIVTLTNSLSTALDAPAYMAPSLRFYGKSGSALVAIGLPMYVEAPENVKISSITIYDQDSYPISTHVITAADKTATGGIGVFCIDNVSLKGTKVHLLFSGADSKNYKVKDIPVSFVDPMATGKTLVEVSPSSAAFIDNFQGVGNFEPSNHKQTNKIVPGTTNPRPIYLACKDSTYTPAPRLANFMITDMLGRSLGQGSDFNSIRTHQCFIAYRENAGLVYRTIIRMT
jgi:hypothetical protein